MTMTKRKTNTGTMKVTEKDNNCLTIQEIMEDQRKQFAERLKTLRENAGLTQQQLADKSGIGKSVIARYEIGGAMPRAKAIKSLASALNASVSDLDGSNPIKVGKAKLKNSLREFGILAEFTKVDTVLLNSIELPSEIEIPLHKLEEILEDTERQIAPRIEPIKNRFFHVQLINNLSDPKIATEFKVVTDTAIKETPPKE